MGWFRWQPQRDPSPCCLTEIFSALACHDANLPVITIDSQLVYLRFDGGDGKVMIGRWWLEGGFVTVHACRLKFCKKCKMTILLLLPTWAFLVLPLRTSGTEQQFKKCSRAQQFGKFRKKSQESVVTQYRRMRRIIRNDRVHYQNSAYFWSFLMILRLWRYQVATLLASNWTKRRQIRGKHLLVYMLHSAKS